MEKITFYKYNTFCVAMRPNNIIEVLKPCHVVCLAEVGEGVVNKNSQSY